MPPDTQLIAQLLQRVAYLESQMREFKRPDRFYFVRDIELPNDIGVKLGTSPTQKLGFFGATPVDRPDLVSSPSGGLTIDSEARTAINQIKARLEELGLTST